MIVTEAYREFITDNHTKYWIIMGGSGSGKSYAITQKLILQAVQGQEKIVVMRKAGVTLNDSCIPLWKSILEKEGIPYEYRTVARELHVARSTVLFRCLDSPERIKSWSGVTKVHVEEATEFNSEDITQLTLRLRDKDANTQFIFSYNPISKANFVYRMFHDENDPEYFLGGRDFKMLKTTWRDNAHNLPRDYITDLLSLRKSNPLYYQVYALGEFGVLGRLIFPQGTYSIKAMEVPADAVIIAGCDPGCTDKFAITLSAYMKDSNTIYTFKEFCQSEVLCKDVAAWSKENIPSNIMIWTDNAGKAQIQELNGQGSYNFRANSKPPGSVISTIDKLHSVNWVINPCCTNLLKDLTYYSYEKDKTTGLYLNEPAREVDGYHCDAIDSVRYSLEGLGVALKPLNIKRPRGL